MSEQVRVRMRVCRKGESEGCTCHGTYRALLASFPARRLDIALGQCCSQHELPILSLTEEASSVYRIRERLSASNALLSYLSVNLATLTRGPGPSMSTAGYGTCHV